MNIAMLTSDFFPNIGGIASHIFYLSRALIDFGHHVIVVHVHATDKDEGPYLNHTHVANVPVVEVMYRRSSTVVGRQISFIYAAGLGINMARKLLGRIDIIHHHDMHPSFIPNMRKWRNEGLRWVWTNHSSQFLTAYQSLVLRKVIQVFHYSVDGIISVSSEIHEKTRRLFPRKLAAFIPNGVDISIFSPARKVQREKLGLDKDAFVVLCPRRMVPKNGVIYLAQAIEIVLRTLQGERIQFVFLGSDPACNTDAAYIRQVKAVLSPLQRIGRVVFLGNVPWYQMADVNAAADLVVIPSLIEAVSLSALEAMASAKPVIATNIGGLRDLINHRENGILVDPASPQQLAHAIVELFKDSHLRTKIAEGGLATVRNSFTWEVIARRTLEFYQQCGITG